MSVTCKLAKFKHRDLKEDESLSEDLTFIEGTFLGLTINPSSLCYINNKQVELSNIISSLAFVSVYHFSTNATNKGNVLSK